MPEKKENVAENVEAKVTVEATQDDKGIIIKIEREEFVSKSTGKTGFDYFVLGKARGKEFKAKVVPPKKDKVKDIGAYEILDIIFNGDMSCDLRVEHNEMEDPNNKGQKIAYDSYVVFSKDEDTGVVFECKVVPDLYSDKVKMNIILQMLEANSKQTKK